MKFFRIILVITICFGVSSMLIAEDIPVVNNFEPQTEDKLNPELLNTLPAVNILNLSGKDCSAVDIENFVIFSLPSAESGVLYFSDGITRIKVDDELSKEESDAIKFDPSKNFEGDAIFEYSALDQNSVVDTTPATVIIPIVSEIIGDVGTNDTNHTTHNDKCSCSSYKENISTLSSFSSLLLLLLTLVIGSLFLRKDLSL